MGRQGDRGAAASPLAREAMGWAVAAPDTPHDHLVPPGFDGDASARPIAPNVYLK